MILNFRAYIWLLQGGPFSNCKLRFQKTWKSQSREQERHHHQRQRERQRKNRLHHFSCRWWQVGKNKSHSGHSNFLRFFFPLSFKYNSYLMFLFLILNVDLNKFAFFRHYFMTNFLKITNKQNLSYTKLKVIPQIHSSTHQHIQNFSLLYLLFWFLSFLKITTQ